MGNPHRLSSPLLEVTMADGATLTVQTANPDLILYERTAARHKWPAMNVAPLTWLTFIAWAALRREAQIPRDLGFEDFSDREALHVTNLTADDTDDDDEDPDQLGSGVPTPPGPGPG